MSGELFVQGQSVRQFNPTAQRRRCVRVCACVCACVRVASTARLMTMDHEDGARKNA